MNLTLIDPELKVTVMEQIKPAGKKITGEQIVMNGMTLRQHYAGLALQSILVENAKIPNALRQRFSLVKAAVRHADELIAELNNTPNPNL